VAAAVDRSETLVKTRRPRSTTLEKRRKILDVVERIMLSDGYAAVTSRRVEADAGIKVHYHFGSIDDLFVAVVRRRGESNVALLAEALSSPEPLRAWWRLASERRGNALLVELSAAANHRPAIRAEVATFAREVRRMQIETLDAVLDDYGIDREDFPSALVAAAIQGLAFAAAYDVVSGFDTAQDEAAAAMDDLLDRLERRRADRLDSRPPAGSSKV
jgi:AcrR family transcriptional regulator